MSTICGQDLLEWLLEEPACIASFGTLEDATAKDFNGTRLSKRVVEGPTIVDGAYEKSEVPSRTGNDPNAKVTYEEKIIHGKNNKYRVLLECQDDGVSELTSSGLTPGLVGSCQGGSRCPDLDGLACPNLWLQRESPSENLFWVDSAMKAFQEHTKRPEQSLTSLWRLVPATERPNMAAVFGASWAKSGADPKLREGISLEAPNVDQNYLQDSGCVFPSELIEKSVEADFDYVHKTTNLGRSTEGCHCKLCNAVEAATLPLFARNSALGDIGNLIASAIISVDLCFKARAASIISKAPSKEHYVTFVPTLPSESGHERFEGAVFPKGDGVGHVRSAEMSKVFQHFEARGMMRNTCVYSIGVAIDYCVYGGPYGGLWAMLDNQFLYDYAIGSRPDCDAELESIRQRCLRASYGVGHEYLGDGVAIKYSNYIQIKFKMEVEEAIRKTGQKAPGFIVWDDIKAMCAFRASDAIFINGIYDTHGDDVVLINTGGLISIHDFMDLGYDIASGEVSNIIPSLCKGDIRPESLKRCYARSGGILKWTMKNRRYQPDGMCIIATFIWQMSNARHRVLENASVVPERLRIRVSWNLDAPFPEYDDLVDDARFIQQTPDKYAITLPWSGQVVQGGPAFEELVAASVTAEEQQSTELCLLHYLTGSEQPNFEVYNPALLRLMCDDDWQRKIDFMWLLCAAMWEEGMLYAAAVSSLRIKNPRPANDDRAGDGYEGRTW